MSAGVLRILIVDDEAPARMRLRDILADCAQEVAFEVVGEAANGRAALEGCLETKTVIMRYA